MDQAYALVWPADCSAKVDGRVNWWAFVRFYELTGGEIRMAAVAS